MRYSVPLTVFLLICGCSQSEEPLTSSTFKPLPIDRLTEIDSSDCEYVTEVVEIEGVVSPGSQGGWSHSDGYDIHHFTFTAWRRPGDPVVRKELTILRPVDPEADFFSEYPNLSIHRIKVLLSTDETSAIFAGKSTQPRNAIQLMKVVEELRKPVIIPTTRFGDLTLDRSIGWFEGEVEWNGKSIRITFHSDENQDISQGLEVAEKLWNDQMSWNQKVNDYAIKELLPLKNDNWLDDGEAPLTKKQFKSHMTLRSVSIYPDGDFEFWHDDGDMFGGHLIQISGSLEDGLTQADIPG